MIKNLKVDELYVIGDVHQKMERYFAIVEMLQKNNPKAHSFQLGDFFVSPSLFEDLNDMMCYLYKHHTMRGNHEYWDRLLCSDVGDFGEFTKDVFFVRGAFSIDKKYQQKVGCWSASEELTYAEGLKALELYEKLKPQVLISHDAPRSIAQVVGNPGILRNFGFDPDTFSTSTSELLDSMLKIHEPRYLIHGHFHKSYAMKFGETLVRGLKELEYVKLAKKKEGWVLDD